MSTLHAVLRTRKVEYQYPIDKTNFRIREEKKVNGTSEFYVLKRKWFWWRPLTWGHSRVPLPFMEMDGALNAINDMVGKQLLLTQEFEIQEE